VPHQCLHPDIYSATQRTQSVTTAAASKQCQPSSTFTTHSALQLHNTHTTGLHAAALKPSHAHAHASMHSCPCPCPCSSCDTYPYRCWSPAAPGVLLPLSQVVPQAVTSSSQGRAHVRTNAQQSTGGAAGGTNSTQGRTWGGGGRTGCVWGRQCVSRDALGSCECHHACGHVNAASRASQLHAYAVRAGAANAVLP